MSGVGRVDAEHCRDDFCLLFVDAEGRVAHRAGSLFNPPPAASDDSQALAGLVGAGTIGWRETLAGLLVGDEGSTLPRRIPPSPTSMPVVSRTGQELALHFVPALPVLNGATIILIEKRGEAFSGRLKRLQTLGTLAAGAAHEMNNLLTVMLGWLELLMLEETPESRRFERLKNIAEAVEKMGQLSSSLLNFARMKSGDFSPVDLNELGQGVIALVDYQLRKDNIELVTSWSPEPVAIVGNEGELSQTLLNLIHNARQAMPGGGKLRISTRCDGEWAVLEVKDSGVGIAREIQERIFDPFFTTRRDDGGTGLGLAVCRETVQRHGGELAVESQLGAGALFTMRIPVSREPVTVDK
jgi:signal transduction histidine kinase